LDNYCGIQFGNQSSILCANKSATTNNFTFNHHNWPHWHHIRSSCRNHYFWTIRSSNHRDRTKFCWIILLPSCSTHPWWAQLRKRAGHLEVNDTFAINNIRVRRSNWSFSLAKDLNPHHLANEDYESMHYLGQSPPMMSTPSTIVSTAFLHDSLLLLWQWWECIEKYIKISKEWVGNFKISTLRCHYWFFIVKENYPMLMTKLLLSMETSFWNSYVGCTKQSIIW